jgi:hypothetical protein
VKSDGSLGQYQGGQAKKRRLLLREGVKLDRQGKVVQLIRQLPPARLKNEDKKAKERHKKRHADKNPELPAQRLMPALAHPEGEQ